MCSTLLLECVSWVPSSIGVFRTYQLSITSFFSKVVKHLKVTISVLDTYFCQTLLLLSNQKTKENQKKKKKSEKTKNKHQA